jgi:hypothetical protein
LRDNSSAEILGLTATPCRQDRKPLGNFFKKLICGPSTRELIEGGYLSDFIFLRGIDPDLSDITMLAGDYNPDALGASAEAVLLTGKPWEQWKREGLRGPSLLFAPNRESSKKAAQLFSENGVRAAHVDFETPARERKAILEGWKNGNGVELICNVNLFAEGLNCPHMDSVFLLRSTKSLALFRQMVGRGLRLSPDGRPVKIFDHAGCVAEHGLPDDEIDWSLSKMASLAGAFNHAPTIRFCEECGAQMAGRTCPHCGKYHETEPRAVAVARGLIEVLHGPPERCVSKAEYARMREKSCFTIRTRIRQGMPVQNGWVDPDAADAWIEARKVKNTERTRAMQADPEFAAKRDARMKAMSADPEFAAKRDARMKAMSADPEFAAKRDTRLKEMNTDPEFAAKRDTRLKEMNADPEFTARNAERMRAMQADPEFAARNVARLKAMHADPEFAARSVTRMKEMND